MQKSLSYVSILSITLALVWLGPRPAHAQTPPMQAVATRFEFDGTLDTTFSGDGHAVIDVPNSAQEDFLTGALTTVTTTNDRIIAAGARLSSTNVVQLLLARLITSSGALDTSFGTGGLVSLDISGFAYKAINKVVIDSSRRIVAMGVVNNSAGRQSLLIARFTSAGAFDTTFNGTGRVIFNFDSSSNDAGASGLVLDSSGRIVVGAQTTGTDTRGLLLRFTTSGGLDTTFGSGGKVKILLPGTTKTDIWDVAIDANNKIVAAGRSSTTALADRAFIARFTTTGALDTTFNGNGVQLLTFPGNPGVSAVYDVAVDMANNYTVCGRSLNPSTNAHDLAIARFLPSGAYDTSFGGDGRVTTSLSNEALSMAYGIRLVFPLNVFAPPMVVTGGLVPNTPNTSSLIAVGYNSDGTLFDTYGDGGIAITHAPGVQYHEIRDAFVQTTNGRVTTFGDIRF